MAELALVDIDVLEAVPQACHGNAAAEFLSELALQRGLARFAEFNAAPERAQAFHSPVIVLDLDEQHLVAAPNQADHFDLDLGRWSPDGHSPRLAACSYRERGNGTGPDLPRS